MTYCSKRISVPMLDNSFLIGEGNVVSKINSKNLLSLGGYVLDSGLVILESMAAPRRLCSRVWVGNSRVYGGAAAAMF